MISSEVVIWSFSGTTSRRWTARPTTPRSAVLHDVIQRHALRQGQAAQRQQRVLGVDVEVIRGAEEKFMRRACSEAEMAYIR